MLMIRDQNVRERPRPRNVAPCRHLSGVFNMIAFAECVVTDGA
jgi:hypothetical protein